MDLFGVGPEQVFSGFKRIFDFDFHSPPLFTSGRQVIRAPRRRENQMMMAGPMTINATSDAKRSILVG